MVNKLLAVALLSFCFQFIADAQVYNSVYWGTYFNDADNYSFNYNKNELVDQIITDHKDPESIYVVGKTWAPQQGEFPACNGNESLNLGNGNGYIAKYNRCGELQWSTYLQDYAQCIALDVANGKTIIYVAGKARTLSLNGQLAFACDGNSTPVFRDSSVDNSDAFIAKLIDNDTAATLLRWTYLGGTDTVTSLGIDNILAIAINKHRVFVTGNTTSYNLHVGAINNGDTISGGDGDSFMAEFDSLLSTLKFFTYIGGSGNDRAHDLKIWQQGPTQFDIFLSGTSNSTTHLAGGTGFDTTINGNTDCFLQKWEDTNLDGTYSLTWGTYIGGANGEHSRAMEVDKFGNLYLTAYTKSTDLPVTPFAYDQLLNDDGISDTESDAFIIKVNNSGANVWCTYVGGANDELVNGLALVKVSSAFYVIIAGLTRSNSSSFPLVSSLQPLLNGTDLESNYDGFISIVKDVSTSQQPLIFSSYIGGSSIEGVQTGLSYHPSIFLGPHKELYFTMATHSSDIQTVMGPSFPNQIESYTGGSDAFVAKIVNSNNPKQVNCAFRLSGSVIDNPKSIYAFPNPTTENLQLKVNAIKAGMAQIQIFDVLGSPVQYFESDVEDGLNFIPLNIEDLPAGIYLIRYRQDDVTYTVQLVKQ